MKTPPFVCKGSTVSVLVIHLHTLDLPVIAEAALKTFGKRGLFGGKPCILDVGDIPPVEQQTALKRTDWQSLKNCFAEYGLNIAGTRGAEPELAKEAEASGLTTFTPETRHIHASPATPTEKTMAEGGADKAAEILDKADTPNTLETHASENMSGDMNGKTGRLWEEKGEGEDAEEKQAKAVNEEGAGESQSAVKVRARGTLFLDRPLRSGQVVYARDSDLIVTAFVSAGAEIIADGNIYSYAPMRGRAHAGANGDTGARIFATHFAAEVVAIAHQPLALVDGIPPALLNHPVQIRRENDEIRIEALAVS